MLEICKYISPSLHHRFSPSLIGKKNNMFKIKKTLLFDQKLNFLNEKNISQKKNNLLIFPS